MLKEQNYDGRMVLVYCWVVVFFFFFPNRKGDKKWLHFNYLISLRQKEECKEKVQPLKERLYCNMNRHI